MNQITLSIIIISYNTREMTLECLRSVFNEANHIQFEIIVLDNASNDGTVNAIKLEFTDRVKLIASTNNLGFAAGNNEAIKNSNGKYILLLNPDTVVLDSAIDHLLEFSQAHPEAGVWGGKTLFKNRTLNPASCWSKQTIWSLFCQASGLSSLLRKSTLFNPEGIGGWNRKGVRSVDIVSGCFLLIERELWNKLGGFHNSFFMYGEEADLCLRAHEYGACPMVTSTATIIHYGGASEKIKTDKVVRLLKAKNLLIHYHFSTGLKWLALRLLYLWPYSRYVVHTGLMTMSKTTSSDAARAVWAEVIERKAEWFVSRIEERDID